MKQTQLEVIEAGLANFSQDEQNAIGAICAMPKDEAIAALETRLQALLHSDPWGNGRNLDTYAKQANFIRELLQSLKDG